jgi:hypothetical protein
MLYLKQSTAGQALLLGPFVDDTDGATAETALSIANTDIRLSANGGNMFAKTSLGGTHDEAGWYAITLDATDTATVGRLQISSKVAGALHVLMECQVVEEAVFVALYAASAPGYVVDQPVNTTKVGGTTQTALDINDILTDTAEIGTAGAGLSNIGTIATVTTLTDHTAQTGDTYALASGATGFAAIDTVVDDILTDTAVIGALGAGLTALATQATVDAIETDTQDIQTKVDKIPLSDGVITWNATALTSINTEADSAFATYDPPTNTEMVAAFTEIKGATWATTDSLEAIRDHATTIKSETASILTDTGTTIPGTITTAQNDLDTITGATGVNLLTATQASIDAIEADTNELQVDDYVTSIAALQTDLDTITDTGVDVLSISGSTAAADNLEASALGVIKGIMTGTPSTTVIAATALVATADDTFIGRVLVVTSGNAAGEATNITDYTGTGRVLTVTALASTPGVGDTFVIV